MRVRWVTVLVLLLFSWVGVAEVLLLLPGPVRSLVLSVEGVTSPQLDELVDRAAALATSGDRLVATVGTARRISAHGQELT